MQQRTPSEVPVALAFLRIKICSAVDKEKCFFHSNRSNIKLYVTYEDPNYEMHKKFNVYVKTKDECEKLLAEMIKQKKEEIKMEKEKCNKFNCELTVNNL